MESRVAYQKIASLRCICFASAAMEMYQCTTYVENKCTINNEQRQLLALLHIHRDFRVNIDKLIEKFVSV